MSAAIAFRSCAALSGKKLAARPAARVRPFLHARSRSLSTTTTMGLFDGLFGSEVSGVVCGSCLALAKPSTRWRS